MSEHSLGSAAERLRAAVEARTRGEIDEVVAIAAMAAEAEWPADAPIEMVGGRPVRIGADGTALMDEFLPLEVAALEGISVAAATWLIRDVVNLKARHPLVWLQATRGLVRRTCPAVRGTSRDETPADLAGCIQLTAAEGPGAGDRIARPCSTPAGSPCRHAAFPNRPPATSRRTMRRICQPCLTTGNQPACPSASTPQD